MGNAMLDARQEDGAYRRVEFDYGSASAAPKLPQGKSGERESIHALIQSEIDRLIE